MVENGTVSVVVPASVVARTCASRVEPRMKFTTGSPKPRFARLLPVIVKLAGGLARSTTSGLIALTTGTGRVSGAVGPRVAIRLRWEERRVGECVETCGRTARSVRRG